jgi:cell division protein FtsX
MVSFEQKRASVHASDTGTSFGQGNSISDQNQTYTASGIQVTEFEDLIQKAQELVNLLGKEVKSKVIVTHEIPLPARFHSRAKSPAVEKSAQSTFSAEYKHVQVRSSKSHIKRLTKMNARATIHNLPQERSLLVDARGRIKSA